MIRFKFEFDKNELLVGFLRDIVICENRKNGVLFVDEGKIFFMMRYVFWVRNWRFYLSEGGFFFGNVFYIEWYNV